MCVTFCFCMHVLVHVRVREHRPQQQAHTAISILSDVYGFISYDQREQNMHSSDDDEH